MFAVIAALRRSRPFEKGDDDDDNEEVEVEMEAVDEDEYLGSEPPFRRTLSLFDP